MDQEDLSTGERPPGGPEAARATFREVVRFAAAMLAGFTGGAVLGWLMTYVEHRQFISPLERIMVAGGFGGVFGPVIFHAGTQLMVVASFTGAFLSIAFIYFFVPNDWSHGGYFPCFCAAGAMSVAFTAATGAELLSMVLERRDQ